MKTRIIIVCICLLSLGALILSHKNSRGLLGNPPVYSKQNMLASLWYHYKLENLEPNTLRALDKERDSITTSEGQSYTMLRAVWMNDKPVFDQTWQFTKDNLQHKNGDHLMSWLFGQKPDGTYGVIVDQGGDHTASDADSDIALALLFASKRWNNDAYKGDALNIIKDIWTKEVVLVKGKYYLAAGDTEKIDKTKNYYVLNPSYFAPYAYRIFAEVDPAHPWLGLVDTSYEVLNRNMDSLGASSTGLPSDWLALDKRTGGIGVAPKLSSDYSFDAMRIPWRLALDREWFGSSQALDTLSKLKFLNEEWSKGKILTHYAHTGDPILEAETPAMYGGVIGYFMSGNAEQAEDIYMKKLESLYDPDTFTWKDPQNYYDSNWAWFGMGLYNHLLPNLYPIGDISTI